MSRVRGDRRRLRGAIGGLAWHLLALAVLFVLLYPLFWLLGASFTPGHEIVGRSAVIPENWTLENYASALDGIGNVPAWVFFRNSLLISTLSVVGVLASCSLAAYAFARLRFPGRTTMFVVMLSTLLLPIHVILIPQYIIFNHMGLVDTYVPLLIGKFLAAEAFFVFLMVQFMRGIPRELDEAARIDGAGHWRIFAEVLLPLMKPALVTSAIFTFIWSWNDFLPQLVYLQSFEKFPVPLALRMFIDAERASDFGGMIAMSLLSLVPIGLFFLAFQRLIVQGMATAGLKG
jgi:multiple sugar transport system permease protein